MKYRDEHDAKERLSRNNARFDGKTIIIRKNSMGIKLWGAIDYLRYYCGYKLIQETK